MPSYLHPGVYVEEIPSGSKPIEAAGTSTAIFIGYVQKGPIGDPVLITSWAQYEAEFDELLDTQSSVSGSLFSSGDAMGLAVYAFFQNGGAQAYITRAVGGTPLASTGVLRDGGDSLDALAFSASSKGTWGDELVIQITSKDSDDASNDNFLLEIGTGSGDNFVAAETYGNVTLTSSDADYIVSLVNDSSSLVTVDDTVADAAARAVLNGTDEPTEIALGSGNNGSAPGPDDYDSVFAALLKVRDVNIVLLPGQVWDVDGKSIIESAIAHCEAMKNRMVVFDLPPGSELNSEGDVQSLNLTTSSYAASYYPWPVVRNRFYNPDTNPGAAKSLLVSPAAFAAGMWAKTDNRRGVWKAPAGVESGLLGISQLEYVVEDTEQDYLNPQGINALRRLPNFGSVVWGSRTRSTRTNPEWRYVPVRRTAMFIEESLYNGIQWAVFEPNDHRLWSALRANIESFMNGLFRVGAFQGEKASDAYFVLCGLGQTMTQGDIDRGQVIVQIGFAPIKPAEFVIVRIQQKVQQQ